MYGYNLYYLSEKYEVKSYPAPVGKNLLSEDFRFCLFW